MLANHRKGRLCWTHCSTSGCTRCLCACSNCSRDPPYMLKMSQKLTAGSSRTHARFGQQVVWTRQHVRMGVGSTVMQAPRAKSTAARAIQRHTTRVVQERAAARGAWAFERENVFSNVQAVSRDVLGMGVSATCKLLPQALHARLVLRAHPVLKRDWCESASNRVLFEALATTAVGPLWRTRRPL